MRFIRAAAVVLLSAAFSTAYPDDNIYARHIQARDAYAYADAQPEPGLDGYGLFARDAYDELYERDLYEATIQPRHAYPYADAAVYARSPYTGRVYARGNSQSKNEKAEKIRNAKAAVAAAEDHLQAARADTDLKRSNPSLYERVVNEAKMTLMNAKGSLEWAQKG